MAGKQITDLESVSNFSDGDLLLVRKSSQGTDKKITYLDFVQSIGNPAINGFTAAVDPLDSNTLILTPVNGSRIPSYLVGMKIYFVSPINSTGAVKIKLGNLDAKSFVQYQTAISVNLAINDYVEGVFISDKFHQINNLKSEDNFYTNEYKVILVEIAQDESYTEIHLVSSIGRVKAHYYDGMSISFVCPEDTKGANKIFIDGLEQKFIIEGDETNFILVPFYANQLVHAIYRSSVGAFIKDKYVLQNPAILPITEPDPVNPEEPLIPEQNLSNFVMDDSNSDKKLGEIIGLLLLNKKEGQQVTIKINRTLTVLDECRFNELDLNFITLTSDSNSITINYAQSQQATTFMLFSSCKTILSFSEGLRFNISSFNCPVTFIRFSDMNGFSLKNISCSHSASTSGSLIELKNVENCNMRSVTLNGSQMCLSVLGDKRTNINLVNCIFTLYQAYAIRLFSSVPSITLTINGCDLSTSAFANNHIYMSNYATVTQTKSRAKANITMNTVSPTYGTYIVTDNQQDIATPWVDF